MGSLEKEEDLSPLHELVLWNLFPMVGCLVKPLCRGEILVISQLPREVLPLLNGDGRGMHGGNTRDVGRKW